MNRADNLDRIFAAYRRALPDPEPTAAFMPRLWARIEARKNFPRVLRRWAAAFVTAAAAACIAMLVYMGSPQPAESSIYATTYVDTLDSDGLETLAYAEVVNSESPESWRMQ